MKDTNPEIENLVRERLMALSGAERMRMGADMSTAARRMILASLPAHLDPEERKRQLFERVYGEPFPVEAGRPLEPETLRTRTASKRS